MIDCLQFRLVVFDLIEQVVDCEEADALSNGLEDVDQGELSLLG